MGYEPSILIATKQILGLAPEDDAFDLDIVTHINTAFSVLFQLGVTSSPVTVSGPENMWADLEQAAEKLAMIKSYIFLKTQYLWDPATSGFLIKARENQISEMEWRLSIFASTEALAAAEAVVEEPVD